MANIIDISARLDDAIPKLKFSDTEEYEINDDKNTVLQMQQLLEKNDEDVFHSFQTMFEKLLGKEAMQTIEENHPGVFNRLSTIQVLVVGVTAGINGMSYEEAEKAFFREAKKSESK